MKIFDIDPDIYVKVISKNNTNFLILKLNGKSASISLVVISKYSQKKGIGKLLIQKAIQYCKDNKIEEITIGHSVGDYLWPGIPSNTGSLTIFSQNGV